MPINTKIRSESKPFALGSCGYIVGARAKVDTDSGSSVHKLPCSQSGKMGYGASYGCKSAFRGPIKKICSWKVLINTIFCSQHKPFALGSCAYVL